MQRPLPEILDLAREHQVEQEAFSDFVQQLSALLVRWEIPLGGRRAPLATYLDQRDAAGLGAADEQPVVDALTRQILEVLGYRDGDYTYNHTLTDGSDRPDFTVQVEELLGPLPVFLVEDKSTSVRDFERRFAQKLGDVSETSLFLLGRERAAFLAEQEEGVRRRQVRIDEIQGGIDRLAWALYRPE